MEAAEFDFFSIVVIEDSDTARELDIVGEEGVVLGISRDDVSGETAYAVSTAAAGNVMFDATEISATGRSTTREAFYDGSRIGVRPDGTVSWVRGPDDA